MLHNNDEYFFDKVEIKRTTSYLNTIRIFFGNQCKELELYSYPSTNVSYSTFCSQSSFPI